MPFSPVIERYPGLKRLLSVRRHPVATYSLALSLVAAATLLRWAIGVFMTEGVPFITYFPAIVLATLIGGLWPGVFATILSAIVAWHLFLPAGAPEVQQEISISIFVFVSGINLLIVALLNALVQHVMGQEENLRILVESSPTGIVVVDDDGKIKLVNAATEKLFGYNRTELLGRSVEDLVPDNQAAAHKALRAAFFRRPEARAMGAGRDLSGKRKDGTEFSVDIGLNPVHSNGRTGVLATVIDITDRKKLRDSQQIIIRELQHRTQNLFTVFQALASQSLDEGKTPAEAKQVLNGRLLALAEAYKTLTISGWQAAPLGTILERQLAGFSGRVTVSGLDLVVGPSAAQQFALIIHELATNALKHGSLSTPHGHVTVEGRVEQANGEGVFVFRWRENGGPLVTEPTRKGFGSVILLNAVRQLARSVEMNFDPEGLTYELHLKLSAIGGLIPLAPADSAEANQLRGT